MGDFETPSDDMKDGITTPVDSEKDLQSSEPSVDLQEDAHIQLSKARFILVLVGLVLAIFLVSYISAF